jgi:mannosyltransferase OCH1-like enzyme
MIPTIIHQIYGVFDDGIALEDIPIFHQQVSKTKQFCETNDISYKMWNSQMCRELVSLYPQYCKLYDEFRQPIMKADFMRYLILYHHGGLYVDCDIAPISDLTELFNNKEFLVVWNNDKRQLPYNAVLGSEAQTDFYKDILQHLQESYEEKSKQPIYETWTGRFVFQTTGHFMLQRVWKKHKYVRKLDILKIYDKGEMIISDACPLFEDYNASIWYNSGNQMFSGGA